MNTAWKPSRNNWLGVIGDETAAVYVPDRGDVIATVVRTTNRWAWTISEHDQTIATGEAPGATGRERAITALRRHIATLAPAATA